MKILFIYFGDYLLMPNSSVGKKIAAKTDAINKLGHTAHTLSVIRKHDIPSQPPDGHFFVREGNLPGKRFSLLEEFLDHHGPEYSHIILRYPFAGEELLRLTKKFHRKFIFEHNTFEEEEALINQSRHLAGLKFSLKPSYLAYFFKTRVLKQTTESILGKEILAAARAGLCVTSEIAAYEKSRCSQYQTRVLTNGADTRVDHLTELPPFTDTLKAFMLIGDPAPWHGFERIIDGLNSFNKVDLKMELLIIGQRPANLPEEMKGKNYVVKFLPHSGDYYTKYGLSTAHIAFSTLGLYKKNMQQACSLKLRDSMLRGFPVVLAYHDQDVSQNPAFENYILQLPNDKSALNIGSLFDFYHLVRRDELYFKKIRALAEKHFGYNVKAAELMEILKNLP